LAESRKLEKRELEGDRLISEIRGFMNSGLLQEASNSIEKFFREFPNHPELNLVRSFREEMDEAISFGFSRMQEEIERYRRTENYRMAWESLHRFFDLIPNYPPALELQDALLRETSGRASQFYNQARVFEYEADDLIAAEQYYKRTLETADPRGDLAKKAERRYAEVRRKGIQ